MGQTANSVYFLSLPRFIQARLDHRPHCAQGRERSTDDLVVLASEDERPTEVCLDEKEKHSELSEAPSVFAALGVFDSQINGYLGEALLDLAERPTNLWRLVVGQPSNRCSLPMISIDGLGEMG
jgi:hypothetical protein